MPFIIMSCSTDDAQELQGPTFFGDAHMDQKIIDQLKGRSVHMEPHSGSNSSGSSSSSHSRSTETGLHFRTNYSPSIVLNNLEQLGYRVASFGMGSRAAIWTLHLEPKKEPKKRGPAAKKAAAATVASIVDDMEDNMRAMSVGAKAPSQRKGKAPAPAQTTASKSSAPAAKKAAPAPANVAAPVKKEVELPKKAERQPVVLQDDEDTRSGDGSEQSHSGSSESEEEEEEEEMEILPVAEDSKKGQRKPPVKAK
ncbi:hypothetical protein BV898_16063 [Hypsibius exemplaris]|uniref:GTP cyclohydrolase 1 feedback regulatory protein n=1 Tax=Hypsibius exemplaris TaxID=2072580 RepID=A0A9X6RKU3_HYPEX|nr:hypothetical protein BV898_16063 [Hypsibius exemplaris]